MRRRARWLQAIDVPEAGRPAGAARAFSSEACPGLDPGWKPALDRVFCRSAEVFHEGASARRRPQRERRLGLFRDDRDGPRRRNARLVLYDRSNVACDRRSGRTHGCGPAIELGDTETPHFFLIARFKREHEGAPLVPATILSQRYPEVKISNRSSTANRAFAARSEPSGSWKDLSSGKISREVRRIACRLPGRRRG